MPFSKEKSSLQKDNPPTIPLGVVGGFCFAMTDWLELFAVLQCCLGGLQKLFAALRRPSSICKSSLQYCNILSQFGEGCYSIAVGFMRLKEGRRCVVRRFNGCRKHISLPQEGSTFC